MEEKSVNYSVLAINAIKENIAILYEYDILNLSSADTKTILNNDYEQFKDDYSTARIELNFSYHLGLITTDDFSDYSISYENIFTIANNIKTMKDLIL